MPFFLERGYTIYHLTDKPVEAEAFFISVLDGAQDCIHHIPMVSVEPETPRWGKDAQLSRVEAHWKGVQLALGKLYVELGRKVGIFHTWVDLYSHEYLDRRVIKDAMPAPWCGLYVHPTEMRIYKTWKRRALENLTDLFKYGKMFPSRLRAFDVPMARKIYFLDEGLLQKIKFKKSIQIGLYPEWMYFDVDTNPELISFQRQDGQKILTLTGFLDKRKGLLTLIRAAKKAATDCFFILAGPIGYDSFTDSEKEEISEIENGSFSNILLLNRLLTDGQVNEIIMKTDIVYLAYENFFHSSNIQPKAAFYRKPMITGPKHLISERTRRFQMGWCLPELTPEAVAELLNRIDEMEFNRVVSEGRFNDFCQEHSPERLNRCLEEICKFFGY